MQKRIMIPLLAVAASLLMIALFAVFLFFFGAGAANSSESPEPSQPAYVLREYDGKLGVFPADSDTPQEVIDVPISLLPPYDQAQLRSGVPAANDAELSRLLEDYTS